MKIIITNGDKQKEIIAESIVKIYDKEEAKFKKIRAQYLKIGESIYAKDSTYNAYCINNDYASAEEREAYEKDSNDFYNLNN